MWKKNIFLTFCSFLLLFGWEGMNNRAFAQFPLTGFPANGNTPVTSPNTPETSLPNLDKRIEELRKAGVPEEVIQGYIQQQASNQYASGIRITGSRLAHARLLRVQESKKFKVTSEPSVYRTFALSSENRTAETGGRWRGNPIPHSREYWPCGNTDATPNFAKTLCGRRVGLRIHQRRSNLL